jgi:hypothetical protein
MSENIDLTRMFALKNTNYDRESIIDHIEKLEEHKAEGRVALTIFMENSKGKPDPE